MIAPLKSTSAQLSSAQLNSQLSPPLLHCDRSIAALRCQASYGVKKDHKNILDLIDSINVKSMNGATLLVLDWEKYEGFAKSSASRYPDFDQDMLKALMKANITDYLTRLPFLKIVPSGKLEILSRMSRYEVAPPGHVICKEGEHDQTFYMILKGKATVHATAMYQVDDQSGFRRGSLTGGGVRLISADKFTSRNVPSKQEEKERMLKHIQRMKTKQVSEPSNLSVTDQIINNLPDDQIELAVLNEGEYFGEMAAFIDLPRAATVVATSPCLFATLSKNDFRSFIKVCPDIQNSIEFMMKQHMLQNLIQLKSPFLHSFSIMQARNMASKSEIEQCEKGQQVFKEGDSPGKFYFVYSGSFEVMKKRGDDILKVGHLYPGDYFGELALLNDNPRRATITAHEASMLLSIGKEHFHECFEGRPDLLAEFILRQNGPSVDLKTLLNHTTSREFFIDHLRVEHGLENLMFYESANHFEENFIYMSDAEATDAAQKIVDRFIKPEASEGVNLPDSITSVMIKDIEESNLQDSTFTKGKDDIYTLMDRDLFQRFKGSNSFNVLMQKVNIYNDPPSEHEEI